MIVLKTRWDLGILIVGTLASIMLATAVGSVSVPIVTVVRLLTQGIFQLPVSDDERGLATIIYLIRFPRVIAAAVVGGSLALAGTMMQGLFRNPLADAGLIGVSSGGALAGAIAISTGLGATSSFFLPFLTFGGAVASAFVVYFVASLGGGRASLMGLILCGVALNSLFGSLTTLILSLSKDYEISRQIFFWLMGGLDGRGWTHVQMILPFVFSGTVAALFLSRDLNLLLLGDETASSLGVHVEQSRRFLLFFASLLAGSAVAIAGTIGFVGLVVPHIMRSIVGTDHSLLVPASALGGAVFLVWCDLLCRVLIPFQEIQLGIVTALLGAPFFLHLLIKRDLGYSRAA